LITNRNEEDRMDRPTISLVSPILNGARFLPAALDSIRAQTRRATEFIVCDGGSTDGTREILDQNRDLITHLFVGRDRGMYDALAKGFRAASGDILGWINADDMLLPWCLSCVSDYFLNVPGCDWLTGIPALWDVQGRLTWTAQVAPRFRRKWIAKGYYSGIGLGPIQQECTFFRRELYDKVGGLDVEMRLAGDFDLWRKMARHADLHQVGTILAGFRWHGDNLSADIDAYHKEAGAVRIPGGKFIGAFWSFMAFLHDRWRSAPRLDRLPNAAPAKAPASH
jgi:glycosyltransferase involved in cell wall biosynthesis